MQKATLALALASSVALGVMAVPASASQTYHGFSADQHYVIRGGTPASLEQAADDPMSVFRSRLAYANFRAHLATFTGGPMTDADFRALMRSDRIRLVECSGSIITDGISDSGQVNSRERDCYSSSRYGVEKLIQYRLDDGRWVTVASQWCYNPVHGEVPEPIPVQAAVVYAAPPPPPQPMVQTPTPVTVIWRTPDTFIGGTVVTTGCECCDQRVIGTPSIVVPGGVSQTTTFKF